MSSDLKVQSTTYQELFDQELYSETEFERSVLSPSAYFVDLFRLIRRTIAEDDSSSPLALKERRPDLFEILLNKDNSMNEIPYLDIINGILLEHVENKSYATLASSVFPFKLPYDVNYANAYAASKAMGPGLEEVFKIFETATSHHKDYYQSYLGLNDELTHILEMAPLTTADELNPYYGLAADDTTPVADLSDVQFFLKQTGLSYQELEELLFMNYSITEQQQNLPGTAYINGDSTDTFLAIDNGTLVTFSYAAAATEPTVTALTEADFAYFDRINRIIRLAQALKWDYTGCNWVVLAAGRTMNIAKIGIIKQLSDNTSEDLATLGAILTTIENYGMGDADVLQSVCPFDILLNNQLAAQNGTFIPHTPATAESWLTALYAEYNIVPLETTNPTFEAQIYQRLASGFNISQDDLSRIMKLFGITTWVPHYNLVAISDVYQIVVLQQISGLKINDICNLIPFLFDGRKTIGNYTELNQFMGVAAWLKQYRVSAAQLEYMCTGIATPDTGRPLTDDELVSLFNNIAADFAALSLTTSAFAGYGFSQEQAEQLPAYYLGQEVMNDDGLIMAEYQILAPIFNISTDGKQVLSTAQATIEGDYVWIEDSGFPVALPGNVPATVLELTKVDSLINYGELVQEQTRLLAPDQSGGDMMSLSAPFFSDDPTKNLLTLEYSIYLNSTNMQNQVDAFRLYDSRIGISASVGVERKLLFAIGYGSDDGEHIEITSTEAIDLNQWVNVALTYDGSDLRIYINGVEDTALEYPYTGGFTIPDATDLEIGGLISGATQGAPPRRMASVRIWNIVLSEEEIKSNMLYLIPPSEMENLIHLPLLADSAILAYNDSQLNALQKQFASAFSTTSLKAEAVSETLYAKMTSGTSADSLVSWLVTPILLAANINENLITDQNRSYFDLMQQSIYVMTRLAIPDVPGYTLFSEYDRFSSTDPFNNSQNANNKGYTYQDIINFGYFKTLSGQYNDENYSLSDYFLTDNLNNTTAPPLLAKATGWDVDQITALRTEPFNGVNLSQFEGVYTFYQAFSTALDIGQQPNNLYTDLWVNAFGATKNWEEAGNTALNAAKAKLSEDDYETLTGTVSEETRDALVNYVLQSPDSDISIYGMGSSNDLYEYLLIDVEMSKKWKTSLVLEAITALQLYIYRCQMHLELEVSIVDYEQLNTWWGWMNTYRVWQANREVFLYPENFTFPDLRTDKSELYKTLESDLKQGEINEANIATAFNGYLNNFNIEANLEIIGSCVYDQVNEEYPDINDKIMMLVARTKTSPHDFYYRQVTFNTDQESGKQYVEWEPWNIIDLKIEADYIKPIFAFNKFFIFWSEVVTIESSTDANDGTTKTLVTESAELFYSFINTNDEWIVAQTLTESPIVLSSAIKTDPADEAVGTQASDLYLLYDPAGDVIWVAYQQGMIDVITGKVEFKYTYTLSSKLISSPESTSSPFEVHETWVCGSDPGPRTGIENTTSLSAAINQPDWSLFTINNGPTYSQVYIFRPAYNTPPLSDAVYHSDSTTANYANPVTGSPDSAVQFGYTLTPGSVRSSVTLRSEGTVELYFRLVGMRVAANILEANYHSEGTEGKISLRYRQVDTNKYSLTVYRNTSILKKHTFITDTENGWMYLALTLEDGHIKIYGPRNDQDELMLIDLGNVGIHSLSDISLGNSIAPYAMGYIKEIRIWKTALIAADLNTNYGNSVVHEDIVHYWDCAVGSGEEMMVDLISNEPAYLNSARITSLQQDADDADASSSLLQYTYAYNVGNPVQIFRLTSSTPAELQQVLFAGGINALLSVETQTMPEFPIFEPSGTQTDRVVVYDPKKVSTVPGGKHHLDFGGANGIYYWEIFFFAPYLLAQTFKNDLQFTLAEKWYKYIYNPLLQENAPWNFIPLKTPRPGIYDTFDTMADTSPVMPDDKNHWEFAGTFGQDYALTTPTEDFMLTDVFSQPLLFYRVYDETTGALLELDQVTCANAPVISSGLTVSCWVYIPSDYMEEHMAFVNHGGAGGASLTAGYNLMTYHNGTNPEIDFRLTEADGGANSVAISFELDNSYADRWFFICGSWDGTNLYLFVDGNEATPKAFAGTLGAPADDFTIGNIPYATEEYSLIGSVAEVMIWDKSVASTLNAAYQLQIGNYYMTGGDAPAAYWPLYQQTYDPYNEVFNELTGQYPGKLSGPINWNGVDMLTKSIVKPTPMPVFNNVSLYFDGITYIATEVPLAGFSDDPTQNHIALSVWVYVAGMNAYNAANDYDFILSHFDTATNAGFYVALYKPDATFKVTIYDGTGPFTLDCGTFSSAGWYNIAFTCRAGEFKVFLNGVDQIPDPAPTEPTGIALTGLPEMIMGGKFDQSVDDNPYHFFIGSMSDLQIWNMADSQIWEVTSPTDAISRFLYGIINWEDISFMKQNGCIAYWPLSDESGKVKELISNNEGHVFIMEGGPIPFGGYWRSIPQHDDGIIQFDGTSVYVNEGENNLQMSSVDSNNAIRVDFCVKCTSVAAENMIVSNILKDVTTNDGPGFRVYIGTDQKLVFGLGIDKDTYTDVASTDTLELGRWYYVSCVYDGAKMYIYLDGTENGSADNTDGFIMPEDTDMTIGADLIAGTTDMGNFLTGSLIELRIWNGVGLIPLNPDYMSTYLTGYEPKLVGYWRLNDGSGSQVADIVKKQNVLEEQDYRIQINTYRNDPFDPFVIADLRPVAYQMTIVLSFVDNIIKWGDMLYRQNTRETISEAQLLYITALNMLGQSPLNLGPLPNLPDQTLQDLIDAEIADDGSIEDFMVIMRKLNLPFGQKVPTLFGENPYNYIPHIYFNVAANTEVVDYYETINERLFNIRHYLTIDGNVQNLPLYQPRIDPLMLIQAMANGQSLSSAASAISVPVPYYRFDYLIDKALATADQVIQLGSSLLAALEKKDGEALALLRENNERNLLQLNLDIKQNQVEQVETQLRGLEYSLDSAQYRYDYYTTQIDEEFTTYETEQIESLKMSNTFNMVGQALGTVSGTGYLMPQAGSPFAMTYGGKQIGASLHALAGAFQALSAYYRYTSELSGTMGGWQRRSRDWTLQQTIAEYDIDQINEQIDGTKLMLDSARRELSNLEVQIEQEDRVEEFLVNKFTNDQLYTWMIQKISDVFYNAYNNALDMANMAQKAMVFELAMDETKVNYIKPTYWNSLKKGLLSGEQLRTDIYRLQKAYIDQNKRAQEITKIQAMSQMADGTAKLSQLRNTGKCTFSFEETDLNTDFPGQYARRIKTISISFPAVVGPYQNINATLTQLSNTVILDSGGGSSITLMEKEMAGESAGSDANIRKNWAANQQISLSKGIDDSGMFELSFNDSRYLPFEGTGAVSGWQLQINNYDIIADSLTDVIITLKYQAFYDTGLQESVQDYINTLPITGEKLHALTPGNIQQWQAESNAGTTPGSFRLEIDDASFGLADTMIWGISVMADIGSNLIVPEINVDAQLIAVNEAVPTDSFSMTITEAYTENILKNAGFAFEGAINKRLYIEFTPDECSLEALSNLQNLSVVVQYSGRKRTAQPA